MIDMEKALMKLNQMLESQCQYAGVSAEDFVNHGPNLRTSAYALAQVQRQMTRFLEDL